MYSRITSTLSIMRRTITLIVLFETAKSIELEDIIVPAHVPLGTRAALACRWALGPAEVLYSVKWYKDGREFFRHVPRDSESRRRFPLPGVDVEEADTLGSRLTLTPATLPTAGRYRCEVSGEGPLFPTVSDYADIEVVALPEHGPVITGISSKYLMGDRVQVSCSSGHSRPATQLFWYINGEPLPSDAYTPSYRSQGSLIVTELSLDFEVTDAYFKRSYLKVKCLATIKPIYWKSNEETAILVKNTTLLANVPTISKNQKTKREEKDQNNTRSLASSNIGHNFFIRCLFIGMVLKISRVSMGR